MKFRQRPVEVEAKQLLGIPVNDNDIYMWIEGHVGSFSTMDEEFPEKGVSIDPETGFMLIATPEGVRYAKPGDWIVKNVHGEFYPVAAEIFEQLYEQIVDGDGGEWLVDEIKYFQTPDQRKGNLE